MDEVIADCGLRNAELACAPDVKQRAAADEKHSALRTPHSALAYLLAAAGLLWVLHDFQFAHLRALMAQLDARWIALAVVFDVLSYVCQGLRWRLLLKPLATVSTLRATQAVYAGLFTNEILPLRLGELARAYLISRWTSVRFVAVLPTLVVERLFDALWLVVGIGLTAAFVPLPSTLLRAADVMGLGVIVLAAALFYCVARRPRWAAGWMSKLGDGWQGLGRTRAFYQALAVSLLLMVFQALAFWLVMLGCGLRFSFWVGAAVYLIVHLGTAVPNAPANIGSYQFFTVVGLTLFGVDKATATAFSLVVFVLLTLPLLLLGFAAITTGRVDEADQRCRTAARHDAPAGVGLLCELGRFELQLAQTPPSTTRSTRTRVVAFASGRASARRRT